MRKRVSSALCAGLCLTGAVALASPFTTAAEVRPILQATQAQWLAVREYDGQDLVYFSQLLSWRCGLTQILYGLNDAPPEIAFPMEPCHEDSAAPNAVTGDMVYLRAPLGSVRSIRVLLIYDDGMTEEARFERAQILMP